jgi:hypothetical protein
MSLKIYNNVLLLLTFLNLNLYLVVETQQPISIYDISQDEVSKYADVLEKNDGLPALAKQSFDFDFNVHRSITDREFQTVAERISDKLLKKLATQMVLIGENGVKYSNTTLDDDIGFKTAFFAFRRNSDGKYDVVYCTAKQIRDINWEKIGYATVIAGGTALAVSVAMPGVGLVIGGVIVGATAAATACTATAIGAYQKNYIEMQNVIIGYIGKELSDRKLLLLT